MPRLVLALGATAIAAVVVAVALSFSNPARPGVGGQPSSSPLASPTAAPSAATPRPTSGQAGALPAGPYALEDNGATVTVTIPTPGWTYEGQFSALFKGTEVANLPEATILFWFWPAGTEFYVYGDPCRLNSTRPDDPATTVDEIAAGLAEQQSRDASAPADVTIGGYSGTSITLHVPDPLPGPCEGGEFASYGVTDDEPARFHQGPGQIDQLWVLDLDGAIMIMDAMYRPDSSPELVAEMQSIVESAEFELP